MSSFAFAGRNGSNGCFSISIFMYHFNFLQK
jgi:hypothetical protein